MFYEYLNSKRCYGLEGPDGTYNLYETERRGDSFSAHFRQLEDINKNQVVLYRSASEMYKKLKKIETECKKAYTIISKNSEGNKDVNMCDTLKEGCKYYEEIENVYRKIEIEMKAALEFVED